MLDVLIVARDNKYGLSRDSALLKTALEAAGLVVGLTKPRQRNLLDRIFHRKQARRIIHMERAFPAWFSAGEENILIPNPERIPLRHRGRLRRIDRVLAKTLHGRDAMVRIGIGAELFGFTSPDRLDSSVRRDWDSFFHLAGGNTFKGTENLLALWKNHPEWPDLVLVQKAANAPETVPANVRLYSGYLNDNALRRLQNACGNHLCPSQSEGWGHYILEAMSCGAVTLTTDAPPMNEHVTRNCGILVPYDGSKPRHLGTRFFVEPEALETAVTTLIAMPAVHKVKIGSAARARWQEIDRTWRKRVRTILAA